MQFWPRKRSRRIYPRVRKWPKSDEKTFLGYSGYKAGMTHLIVTDNYKHSMTKDEDVFVPATIIECPPVRIFSVRFYNKQNNSLVAASEVVVDNNKMLAKKVNSSKPKELDVKEEYDDVRVIVYTQPGKTDIGKKKPEIFELAVGGKNTQEKIEFIKQYIGKDIRVSDVFKAGEEIDVKAVTKGKGFQGTTKRYGTKVFGRKTEKNKRTIGSLGPWHPAHIRHTVAQPGKMGYHARTEYNKWIISIDDDPEKVNQDGGFLHYGNIKNDYIILKGSVPGPTRRLIRLVKSSRPSNKVAKEPPQIKYISTDSKQKHR